MKKRLLYIDRLRGINILLMVMGHSLMFNLLKPEQNKVFVWGTTFRMALFMFLSGYIANKTITSKIFDNYGLFVLKKMRTLLIPFFCWPLLINNFFLTEKNDFNLIDKCYEMIKYPTDSFWFLWFLFFITIIFTAFLYITNFIKIKYKLFLDLSVSAILLILLLPIHYLGSIYYIDYFIFNCFFFFFGVIISRHMILQKFILHNLVFTAALILFLCVAGRYLYLGKSTLNLFFKLIAAVSGILVFYFINYKITWHQIVDRYLMYWGRNSIVIYTTHFAIIYILPRQYLLPQLNVALSLVISLIISIIVMFLCLCIYDVIKLSPILNLVFYGHKIESARNEKVKYTDELTPEVRDALATNTV
jgi:fucose 4-O-acetylase-like acetyltransferase